VTISADGMPGVGKTTLAIVLAHHPAVLSHFSDGILWGALGLNADPATVLSAWAGALSVEIAGAADPAAVLRGRIGRRRMLLVIDDAWEADAAEALRCGGPECSHLLTTRDQVLARRFADAARVESIHELDEDEAWSLLRELVPETCAAEPAGARALVRAVGGLPLAVELLGGYLAEPARGYFPDTAAEGVWELADPRRRVRLAAKRLGAHESGVVTLAETVELSVNALPPPAAAAFHALGAFAPKPETFDRAAAEVVTGATSATLGLLLARRLLEQPEPNVLAIHQVLADVARERTPREAVERHRDHFLGQVEAGGSDWRRVERIYPQVKWAWAQLPPGAGHARLGMVAVMSGYQRRRGLWRESVVWNEAALRDAAGLGLARSCAVLANELGWLLDNLGEPARALEYYTHALAITREIGDHAGAAVALNNIGLAHAALGDRPRALEQYDQAVPIFEAAGDRGGLAATLVNSGTVHHAIGDRHRALEHFGRARRIQQEIGDRHGLAVTLNNIGAVYDELRQPEKALACMEQALRINEEAGDRYGEAVTRFNLAQVHRDQGRLTQAVHELQRVVELDELIQSHLLDAHRQLLRDMEEELAEGGSVPST
jgi:tetratricopeptide (TPR) repeat protein